jgi:hypothetical protein
MAWEFLPPDFVNRYFSSWTEEYAAFVERKIMSTPPSNLLTHNGSLLGRGGYFYEAIALDGYNYDGFVTVEPNDIVIDAGAYIGDTA